MHDLFRLMNVNHIYLTVSGESQLHIALTSSKKFEIVHILIPTQSHNEWH